MPAPLEKTIRFFMTKPDIAQAMGEIERVLKHGDFGTSNILFDRQQRTICGMIDFGSSGLGDPAYDLAGLLSSYGEAFVKRCWRVYPEIESFMDRVGSIT
jgi:aminoglycoside 2''-phosphotransferase